MFGWGRVMGWFHSNRNEFLHVIETHITTFSGLKEGEKATISLENYKKISTKPDLKTGVRMYINLNEMLVSTTILLSLGRLRRTIGMPIRRKRLFSWSFDYCCWSKRKANNIQHGSKEKSDK